MFSPWPPLLVPSASVALARAEPNHVLFHDPDELRTGAGAQAVGHREHGGGAVPLAASRDRWRPYPLDTSSTNSSI